MTKKARIPKLALIVRNPERVVSTPDGGGVKMRRRAPNSVIQEAIARVAPILCSHDPFPLAPALSLRESENQGPRCDNSKLLGLSNAIPTMLPLPKEGRGEGERALESAVRWSFAIGCRIFGFPP